MSKVLIIDDDRDWCRSLIIQLELEGYPAHAAHNIKEGLQRLQDVSPELILLDLNLGNESGLDFLQKMRDDGINVPVIMVTGEQDMDATIRAGQLGVIDYLRKPFDLEDVLTILRDSDTGRSETPTLIPLEPASNKPGEIIGANKKVIAVLQQIGKLAQSQVNVLITGESGTGKEFIARALHAHSAPDQPFVAINCTSIVENLLESEFFGHEKGAFTGADRQKIGKFEMAGKGTIFLDEIGDMPIELQAKLLRVLEQREFQRVGGLESVTFKARIIAATHHSLEALISEDRFRKDLYYRLNVARLELPPLRERADDIVLLTNHLVGKIGEQLNKSIEFIDEKAMTRLQAYHWPGNIRELENVLTRALAITNGNTISDDDIHIEPQKVVASLDKDPSLKDTERATILSTLERLDWNISKASETLQITRTTLRKKIKDYNIVREDPSA